MSQIQVRDENGKGIAGINVRIALGDNPQEQAIYDVFTDLAGNSGWPIPYWPIQPYTLYANVANVNPKYTSATVKVLDGNDVLIQLQTIVPPFPDPPSRGDACRIRQHFQGLMIHSAHYGDLPWFPAGLIAMDAVGELDSTIDQLLAAGDTHAQVDLKFNYGEAGQPWGTPQLVPDRDLSNDLATYCRIVDRVIMRGLKPIFVMPAEGQPGLQWLYSSAFENVVMALKTDRDRTRYGPFQLAYDGTWPANWSVQQVKDILPYVRRVIGDQAHLAMMFACGPAGNPYLYVEDESDYSKPWMQALDIVIASVGPDQVVCPALVNNAMYMIGPALKPSGTCTPGWQGPWIMAPQTPRGPYVWCFGEWREFDFVRQGAALVAEITADQQRIESVGIVSHG